MGLNIKSLLSGSVSSVLDSAKGIIGQFVADPTEKAKALQELTNEGNRHEETMLAKANEIEQAYLADTQSARAENTKIQESANASWLAKNVGYCIDIFLMVVFAVMLCMIIYKSIPPENKELFYTSFGMLGMYVGQCIGYHRGSSSGSKAKSDQIDKIIGR